MARCHQRLLGAQTGSAHIEVDGARTASHAFDGNAPQAGFRIRNSKRLGIGLLPGIAGRVAIPAVMPSARTDQVQVQIVSGAIPCQGNFKHVGPLGHCDQLSPPLRDGNLRGILNMSGRLAAGQFPTGNEVPALPAVAEWRSVSGDHGSIANSARGVGQVFELKRNAV